VALHLVILFSIVTVFVGVVAIVVAALGVRNTGDEERRSYLAFLIAFTVSVVLYVIRLYVDENLGGAGATFTAVWGAVDGLVDLSVVVTGVVFFHALYELSFRRRVLLPLLSLSLGVYLVFLVSGLQSLAGNEASVRPGLYLALGYYYLLFAYLIGLNLIHLRTLSGARKRFFGYGLFLFLLVGAVESALSIPRFPGASLLELALPRSIYISVVPYLLWCGVSSVFLTRIDRHIPVSTDLQRFCERHGITPREREVLVAIGKGWSNQEIADRLFISLQTVKTHAHHLYEKTDTTGRTSLLASIQSFD
jgi:DNA-binding CsgD family transcriptional regulator